MARTAMTLAAHAKQAEAAARRYTEYLKSDPISPKGQFVRSPQAVASENNIGRRQVERHRSKRMRLWQAEALKVQDAPEPVTREQVEVALLITCNYVGEGGPAREALVIAAALGISREAFAIAREMLGDDKDGLPASRIVKLYNDRAEWLGEWGASARA